ncbi:MAG: hypothetical protein ACF8XB_23465 [Planctomycetota bacterium JB042]
MRVYFSTVIRSAPPLEGGELVALDWSTKEIVARVPIAPTDPDVDDPNPRGNTRGGRGIELLGDEVVCGSFHSLHVFDRDLRPRRKFSHPLMVSLHESVPVGDGTVWTTSTAIDAALRFDLADGKLVDARWPREMPGIAAELGVTPLEIDKGADNRGRFLGSEHARHPHHLHLNAVTIVDGRLHALFSKHGVVADLDRDRIAARDKALKGSHNLTRGEDGNVRVSHTVDRGVATFDLAEGRRVGRLSFADDAGVRRLLRGADRVYKVRKWLEKRGLHTRTPPRPAFVRGLACRGGRLFVGISPATILEIDEASGEVVDRFTYSRDVKCCVHGLEVAE